MSNAKSWMLDFDFTGNIKLLQTRRPRGMII